MTHHNNVKVHEESVFRVKKSLKCFYKPLQDTEMDIIKNLIFFVFIFIAILGKKESKKGMVS